MDPLQRSKGCLSNRNRKLGNVPEICIIVLLAVHLQLNLLLPTAQARVTDGASLKTRRSSEFGGDFTAAGLSGNTAPGPTSNTMGSQAASAMAIGTGGSGPGDYTSNFKTPNYTQYTQQDFKGKEGQIIEPEYS